MSTTKPRLRQSTYSGYDVASVFNIVTQPYTRNASAISDEEHKKMWLLMQPLLLGKMFTHYTELLRVSSKERSRIGAVFHVTFYEYPRRNPDGSRSLARTLHVRSVSVSYNDAVVSAAYYPALLNFYADFFSNIKLKEVLM